MTSRLGRALAGRAQLALTVAAASIAGIVVTAMRRPNQFSWPGLWVEEGFVLVQWTTDGFGSIFHDINGTYPVITRLLLAINLELSPAHWVRVNAIVAAMVIGVVVAAIVAAPTVLRGRWLVAVFVLLIPTDAEVFGVLLYSFWWLSLLALVSVLWNPTDERLGLRVPLGWIGALSSPAGAFFGLLGFLRFALTKAKNDLRAAVLTLPACAVTLFLIVKSDRPLTDDPMIISGWSDAVHMIGVILGKFVGAWTWSPSGADDITMVHTVVGGLAMMAVAAVIIMRPRDWAVWVMAIAMAGAVVASILRVSPTLAHPFVGGPRYFFFPFVLLGMLMVRLASLPSPSRRLLAIRATAGLLVAVALLNIAVLTLADGRGHLPSHLGFRRFHPVYDWVVELTACAGGAGVGTFHDGAEIASPAPVSAEACSRLLSRTD